jgi:Mrp family chromosome partitioning ATPase
LLALASQSPNRKTLLVDGDLLTSHPNRFYGIREDQTPGVKAILDSEGKIDTTNLIVKTVHEGLSVMPRGDRMEPSPLPTFLEPVKKALDRLRTEYDVIFIDTPPLFAANLAHQWTGLADLIVLVARIYNTRPKDITEGLQTCKIFSKSPVGIVLNCVPLTGAHKRVSNYYFSKRKNRPTRLAA